LEFRANMVYQFNNHLPNIIYNFSGGLFLKLTRGKNSTYNEYYPYCYKIQLMEENIGLLYAKSETLTSDDGLNIIIKLDNHISYTKETKPLLNLLVNSLGLNQMIIKRLDIAYDTSYDILTDFKNLYNDPSVEFKNEGKIKVLGTGPKDDYTTIGSKKSITKFISIYNKTNELKKSNKDYIRYIHTHTLGYKKIYRIELRLFYKLIDIKKIDLMRLGDVNYLESLFKDKFESLVQFQDKKTGGKINLITLNNASIKILKSVRLKSNTGGAKQTKTAINFIDKELGKKHYAKVKKYWGDIREAIIKKNNLEDWDLMKKYN
jgi:hypothetical protein